MGQYLPASVYLPLDGIAPNSQSLLKNSEIGINKILCKSLYYLVIKYVNVISINLVLTYNIYVKITYSKLA